MTAGEQPDRSIWWDDHRDVLQVIDQRHLPHELRVADVRSVREVFAAIREMQVRGAPLIGVAAAYGVYLAVRDADAPVEAARDAARLLLEARPTAVNLGWAIQRVVRAVQSSAAGGSPADAARREADRILQEEVERCRRIGEYGLPLIRDLAERSGKPVNILTHCNAGWLACVEYGTATAPIYLAQKEGIPVHVWVDETRPRNQGARLTAWELQQRGVPHTVIVDNAGGHLMRRGMVDLVLVGTDRTTRAGDVINKIGTYLKALAAADNDVPFWVALPSSTIDWTVRAGDEVPIEERDGQEVRYVRGAVDGKMVDSLVTPADSPVANHAFDVTPARLVTGLITERGRCAATEAGLASLFPERSHE